MLGIDTDIMAAELGGRFPGQVRVREPLSRHTTFGVGGPADAWIAVRDERQLAELVEVAIEFAWPLMLVGNGTNILYADAGVRGIVAHMAACDYELIGLDQERTQLRVAAGASLPKLINELAARGISGLEWGAGVPGTIGGAIVSNAGAHGGSVSDTIQSARVLISRIDAPAGSRVIIREMDAAELRLAYRDSRFRAERRITFDDAGHPTVPPRALIEPAEMILGGTFILRYAPSDEVKARAAQYRQHRKETQPAQGSAGSVFKNPPNDYSGRLIEAAGLKGHMCGRAQISPVHANFIVNAGGATAADVVGLMALARRTVRERFGIELELEVELRGEW